MDEDELRSNIVKIHYGPNSKPDYGYVVRFVESCPTKDTYIVATRAYPRGRYYKKNFLEWIDPNDKIMEFIRDEIIAYRDDPWEGFVEKDNLTFDFFMEMSEILPKYHMNQKKRESRIHVCIYENGEGPVPHVHVYYESKEDKRNESHICLATNTYAPQHAATTKKLNSAERKALIEFFKTKITGVNGSSECTAWEYAVWLWTQYYDGSSKFFKYDNNGKPIMPDYSTIEMPSKQDIQHFSNLYQRNERW